MYRNNTETVARTISNAIPDVPVYAQIPCSLCGKEHDAMVIDGHISQPHVCGYCFRKLAEEWRKERKEVTNE